MANNGGAPPVGHEGINTDIVTLTRFFTEEQVKAPEATGDFTYVSPPLSALVPFSCRNHHKLTLFGFAGLVFSATLFSSLSSPLPTTSDGPL